MTSDITKSYKRKYVICRVFDLLLELGPLLVFIIYGFITAEPKQKVGMAACVVGAIIIAVINIMFKKHLRSVIWLITIGIAVCVSNIIPFMACMAGCTFFEEFVTAPLCKYYKEKLSINKEIDKRYD